MIVRIEERGFTMFTQVKVSPENEKATKYNQASNIFKARLSHQCEVEYRKNAEKFEYGLANIAQKNSAVHKNADEMLERLKKIVDAWQQSLELKTEEEEKKNLEKEFKHGGLYYGAIKTSARTIKKIFNDKSKPLRLKYRLLYNCLLNGNFTKWLKTLAFQYQHNLETVRVKKGKKDAVIVKNFYGRLDKDIIEDIGLDKLSSIATAVEKENKFAETQTKESIRNKFSSEETEDAIDVSGRGGVIDQDVSMKRNYLSRSSAKNLTGYIEKKSKQEEPSATSVMRHLKKSDVDDLTKEEWSLMGFKSKPTEETRLTWTQGSEDTSLLYGTSVTKQANEFKARMEAGISGTTDLMMHAAEYLGVKSQQDKKILRMGLAGWMIAGRDHSFYEIFKSAESYGVKFNIDKNKIGSEYEDEDNLSPLTRSEVEPILDGKFPSYYYSDEYLMECYNKNNGLRASKKIKENNTREEYIAALKLEPRLLQRCSDEQLPFVEGLLNLVKAERKNATSLKHFEHIQHKYREIKRDVNYVFLASTLNETAMCNIMITLFQKNKYPFEFIKEALRDKKETQIAKIKENIMTKHITDGLKGEELINAVESDSSRAVNAIQKSSKEEMEKYKSLRLNQSLAKRVDDTRLYNQTEDMREWKQLSKEELNLLEMPQKLKVKKGKKESEKAFENRKERAEQEYWGINTVESTMNRNESSDYQKIKDRLYFSLINAEPNKRLDQIKNLQEGYFGRLMTQSSFILEAEEITTFKNTDDIMKQMVEDILKEESREGLGDLLVGFVEFLIEPIQLFIKTTATMMENIEKAPNKTEQMQKVDKRVTGFKELFQEVEPEFVDLLQKQIAYQSLDKKELGAINRYTSGIYKAMQASSKKLKDGVETKSGKKMDLEEAGPLILAATSGLAKLPVYKKPTYRIRNINVRTNNSQEGESDNDRELTEADVKYAKKKFKGKEEQSTTGAGLMSSGKSTDCAYIGTHWGAYDTLEYITNIKTGHDIQLLSDQYKEEEILFEPGARFKVTDVKLASNFDKIPQKKRDKFHLILEKEEI